MDATNIGDRSYLATLRNIDIMRNLCTKAIIQAK